MEPVEFPECNTIYAKDQPEYLPLPAHRNAEGYTISCWKMSLSERIRALLTGRIYLSVLNFASPLQPQRLTVEKPCHFMDEPARKG